MNVEQGHLTGHDHALVPGVVSSGSVSVGQRLLKEGISLRAQGDRTGAAQVLAHTDGAA